MKVHAIVITCVAILFSLLAGKVCFASTDFLSAPMFSGLSAEEKRLLAEYREHYDVLNEHYENAFIVAKEEMKTYVTSVNGYSVFRSESEGPVRIFVRDYEYRANGGKYYRLDERQVVHSGQKKEDTIPRVRLGLIADDKSFLLSKSNPQARYYSLNAKRKTGDSTITMSIYDHIFPFLAFSETGLLLEYILFRKPHYATSCNVLSVVGTHSEQGEIVTVVMVAANEKDEKVSYRFEFFRDHHWVIKSSIVDTGSTTINTKNEYVFVEGNVPELKRSTIEGKTMHGEPFGNNQARELKLSYFRSYDIIESKFGPVDLSEFDVAQFLPPGVKIGEVTPAGLSTARIASIVIGVILLILGIYMKIRIALREKRNNKP